MIIIRKMWKIDEILNHLVRPDSFRIYTFFNKFEFTNGSGHPYPFLGVCIITCKKVVIYPKLVFFFFLSMEVLQPTKYEKWQIKRKLKF